MDISDWATRWTFDAYFGRAEPFAITLAEDNGRWSVALILAESYYRKYWNSTGHPHRLDACDWAVRTSFKEIKVNPVLAKAIDNENKRRAEVGMPPMANAQRAASQSDMLAMAQHQLPPTWTFQVSDVPLRVDPKMTLTIKAAPETPGNGPLRIVDENGDVFQFGSYTECTTLIKMGRQYEYLTGRTKALVEQNSKMEVALGKSAAQIDELRQTIAEQEIELRRAKRGNVKR